MINEYKVVKGGLESILFDEGDIFKKWMGFSLSF